MIIKNIEEVREIEVKRAKDMLEVITVTLDAMKRANPDCIEDIKNLELQQKFYEKLVWKLERLDPTI